MGCASDLPVSLSAATSSSSVTHSSSNISATPGLLRARQVSMSDRVSRPLGPTRTATDSTELSTLIKQREPHLVILDIWLKDSPQDGLEILDILRKDYPKITVIMISGHANIETAISALRRGAYDFIEKPFKEDHLIHRVARALETVSLKEENATLRKKEKALRIAAVVFT